MGILILFSLIGLSGCVGPQVTEEFNGSYEVNDQTILTVANTNGPIEIVGWDGGTVIVKAVKKSTLGKEELDNIQINVSMNGNNLRIRTQYSGLSALQGSVDMSITVPRTIHLESVTSSNGPIHIQDSKGNITVESSNGGIFIDTVDGFVSAQTSNGHIEVKATTGIRNLRSSNGPIIAEIADVQQDIRIETSNGAVTIALNPLLNASLEMTTSNGKIKIEGISLNLELLTETHVIGSLGSEGPSIDIRTSNGNIHLNKLLLK